MSKFIERAATLRAKIESQQLLHSVGALFDHAVAGHGDKLAWIDVDSNRPALTYKGLDDLVRQSLNGFIAMGVKKGHHVALIMPTVPEHLCAWLALAKIGAVSVGVNPGYTSAELKYTLTDSKSEFLLVDAMNAEAFYEFQSRDGYFDESKVAIWGGGRAPFINWQVLLSHNSTVVRSGDDPDFNDPCNILYTSGSTGFPKGCVLPHSYWIIKGKVVQNIWPETNRIQCDAPFHYMGPLWRFAFAAYSGAALCVAPKASLTKFVDRWQKYKADFGWINNAMAMTDMGASDGDNSLKVLGTSGISKVLHKAAEERFGAPIRENYGMTEIGLALYVPIDAVETVGSGTCGIPAPFRECMIADADGTPVQQGEIGELLVAGPGIVKEYIGRPEANREAFHGKWFKTGDLFRQDEQGLYYFHARIKDIIRRSAENISAVEVETALTAVDGIEEVAVGPVKDELRGEEVKAFIILKAGLTPDQISPDKILQKCKENLARYKHPRYFQYYKLFPRTGSNKIAKRLLLDGGGEALSGTYDSSTGEWDEAHFVEKR
nr:class I adenylate-forming enzyme family protein [uncultured Duganella sp.]